MSTKNVSKCSYYGKVLLDLTGDTVTASTLKKGTTAHDATGTKITGTLTIPESQTKTMDLSMASGDQVVKPDSGKVLSQVTVKKPSTLAAENIKKDVNIGGVVGTYVGSGSGGGAYNITATDNGDGTQTLDITDGSGSSGGTQSYYVEIRNDSSYEATVNSSTMDEFADGYTVISGDTYVTSQKYDVANIFADFSFDLQWELGESVTGVATSITLENDVITFLISQI